MQINKVAIVGGGTAGWIAANHLAVELQHSGIEITLIESADIPPIGVGEGTVPRIKETLKKFGISEVALLAECDATFKLGIKFANWLTPNKQGEKHAYYHPFASPYPQGYDLNQYYLNETDLDYSRLTELYHLAEHNCSPKQISDPPYRGVTDYAYHMDAAKFAALLARNATTRFGVKHRFGTIKGVAKNAEGFITALVLNNGEQLEFDFYIDCSGFSSLLMGELNVPLNDKRQHILPDTALVLQHPVTPDEPLKPYTLSTAHSAGWIWDIPLTTRRGLGYVYSANHQSDDDAINGFSQYVGRDLSAETVRKIPMTVGYREKSWSKNCVALGLAQGFIEPLEATSILVTDFSANLLAKHFPLQQQHCQDLAQYYNKVVDHTWQRVIDFVQLHYCISDRTDSQFWRDCTQHYTLSDELTERLTRWRLVPPQQSDFFSAFDIFGVENHLFVMYGMKFHSESRRLSPQQHQHCQSLLQQVEQRGQQLAQSLLPQHIWLQKLKQQLAHAGAPR